MIASGYACYFTPPPAELLVRPDLLRSVGTTREPEQLRCGAVRPERTHFCNHGIRQRVGQSLTLGSEGFYRDLKDMRDLGQVGSAFIFSPHNHRVGRVFGTELTASYRRGAPLLPGNL